MPCLLTAPLDPDVDPPAGQVERLCSLWTTGITKTEAPITTFWPDRSVDGRAVGGLDRAGPCDR